MAKFQSPLLGYNNNVRYRGRVFHIQTEDSGINHPHVITHLFMDGGRILKSVKRSYAEHVGSDGMSETVRVMMKEQHKAMFVALREGQFDELLETPKKAPATPAPTLPTDTAAAPTGVAATQEQTHRAAASKVSSESAHRAADERGASADARNVAPATNAVQAAQAKVDSPASNLTAPNDASPAAAPKRSVETEESPRIPAAAHAPRRADVPTTSTMTSISDADVDSTLPLEIAALLREDIEPEPTTTREPERSPSAHELTLDFDALEPPSHGSAHGHRHDASARQPEESRFAHARAAAFFGTSPRPTSPSIFNDELASDKSLDEIILSYLAEDLDPTSQK